MFQHFDTDYELVEAEESFGFGNDEIELLSRLKNKRLRW